MKKLSQTTREEFWKEQVAKFRQSGESRRQYCLTHKLSYWTFRDWLKKIEAGNDTKLVKISRKPHTQGEGRETCIEIIIAQKVSIRVSQGFDGELLRNVIKELGVLS
jgi:hypothetical protein